MKRILFLLLIFITFNHTNSFALSEAAYSLMLETSDDFKNADSALNKTWKEIYKNLNTQDKKELLIIHRKWLKQDRDVVAKEYMQMGYTKDCAYAKATRRWTKTLSVIEHNLNMSQQDIAAGRSWPNDYFWDEDDSVIPEHCKQKALVAQNNASFEEFNNSASETTDFAGGSDEKPSQNISEENPKKAKDEEVEVIESTSDLNKPHEEHNNSQGEKRLSDNIIHFLSDNSGKLILITGGSIILLAFILRRKNQLIIYSDQNDVMWSIFGAISWFFIMSSIFGSNTNSSSSLNIPTLIQYLLVIIGIILIIIPFIYSYKSNINYRYGIFCAILSYFTKIILISLFIIFILLNFIPDHGKNKRYKTRKQAEKAWMENADSIAWKFIHFWKG